jgi:hypothetical protein
VLTVACVLRSGGDYKAEHVLALRRGVMRHLSVPHRFVCLSDRDLPCETVRLRHGWPGWWSKIELFRPGLFDGPALYFDLDTIVVGPLEGLGDGHRFTMLENFWDPKKIGSGMMAWSVPLTEIYEAFARDSAQVMRAYTTSDKWGDQAFILRHTRTAPEMWQRKYPGKIVSYKFHCRQNLPPKSNVAGTAIVPPGASVICFHGQPRPWRTPLWPADEALA